MADPAAPSSRRTSFADWTAGLRAGSGSGDAPAPRAPRPAAAWARLPDVGALTPVAVALHTPGAGGTGGGGGGSGGGFGRPFDGTPLVAASLAALPNALSADYWLARADAERAQSGIAGAVAALGEGLRRGAQPRAALVAALAAAQAANIEAADAAATAEESGGSDEASLPHPRPRRPSLKRAGDPPPAARRAAAAAVRFAPDADAPATAPAAPTPDGGRGAPGCAESAGATPAASARCARGREPDPADAPRALSDALDAAATPATGYLPASGAWGESTPASARAPSYFNPAYSATPPPGGRRASVSGPWSGVFDAHVAAAASRAARRRSSLGGASAGRPSLGGSAGPPSASSSLSGAMSGMSLLSPGVGGSVERGGRGAVAVPPSPAAAATAGAARASLDGVSLPSGRSSMDGVSLPPTIRASLDPAAPRRAPPLSPPPAATPGRPGPGDAERLAARLREVGMATPARGAAAATPARGADPTENDAPRHRLRPSPKPGSPRGLSPTEAALREGLRRSARLRGGGEGTPRAARGGA